MKIYLIRHFKTENNVNRILMGQSIDSHVKEFNEIFTKYISGNNVELISSPRLRALETIQYIKKELNIEGQESIISEFDEINYGEFEGKTVEEIEEKLPTAYTKYIYFPNEFSAPNGESFSAAQERSWNKLKELAKTKDRDLIIVSHVDIIRLILSKILGVSYSISIKSRLVIDHGAVTILEYKPDSEAFQIKQVNGG